MSASARVCIVAVATTLLAGCGTSEPEAPRAPLPEKALPAAAESTLGRLAARLTAAARRTDCRAVAKLAHPAAALDATGCRRVHTQLAGISQPRMRRFGTGGVIEFFARNGRRRAAVAVLAGNGAYRLLFVADVARRETEGEAPAEADLLADAVIDALAARDCNTVFRLSHRYMGVGNQSRAKVCRDINRWGIAANLRRVPEARPVPEGTDGNFAFYTVRGSEKQRYALVLGRQRLASANGGSYRFVAAVEAR